MSDETKQAPFSLNIDPEAVNKVISQAVLESAIGPEIQKAVDKHIKSFEKEWHFRNHVEEVVKKVMTETIRAEVMKSEAVVQEFVRKNLTDDLMQSILKRMWEKWERGY